MEEPIKEEDEGYVPSRDRHRGSGLIFDKNTYITPSNKFEFTRSEILFSVFYSVMFGLTLTIIGVALVMSSYYEDAPLRVVGYVMLTTFLVLSITIFILRITAKRGMQIFSICLGEFFIAIIIFLWAIIPIEKSTCNQLGGNFVRDYEIRSSEDITPPDYTCFVSVDVFKQVSTNKSFPYNFMTFKVN